MQLTATRTNTDLLKSKIIREHVLSVEDKVRLASRLFVTYESIFKPRMCGKYIAVPNEYDYNVNTNYYLAYNELETVVKDILKVLPEDLYTVALLPMYKCNLRAYQEYARDEKNTTFMVLETLSEHCQAIVIEL